MNEDRLDELLREVAPEYHRPPDTPREAMWAAIQARRRAAPRLLALRPAWRWGLGMAAVLLLGIAIGLRLRSGGPAGSAPGTGRSPDLAYHVAAAQYLSRTETLLTGFRVDARGGRLDPQFAAQARDLLTSTRLLLDSPAGRDPRLKPLLEDLEVLLAQIALLPGAHDRADVKLITQGIDQQSVLLRLRTAIPAGPVAAARTQGVL